jgi:hypothetical protein
MYTLQVLHNCIPCRVLTCVILRVTSTAMMSHFPVTPPAATADLPKLTESGSLSQSISNMRSQLLQQQAQLNNTQALYVWAGAVAKLAHVWGNRGNPGLPRLQP